MFEIRESPIAGKGAFATRAIKKGECVGEYEGELITNEEADRRYEHEPMTYLFSVEDNMCVDAMHVDCGLKFINHCCDPNCFAEVVKHKVFYYAKRDIRPGEELTVDYELIVDEKENDPCTCNCGSANCRGTMKEVKQDS
jgi:uncharacterized protein